MQEKSDATVHAHRFACQHPAQCKRGQGTAILGLEDPRYSSTETGRKQEGPNRLFKN